jgi:hypothetical protein
MLAAICLEANYNAQLKMPFLNELSLERKALLLERLRHAFHTTIMHQLGHSKYSTAGRRLLHQNKTSLRKQPMRPYSSK